MCVHGASGDCFDCSVPTDETIFGWYSTDNNISDMLKPHRKRMKPMSDMVKKRIPRSK